MIPHETPQRTRCRCRFWRRWVLGLRGKSMALHRWFVMLRRGLQDLEPGEDFRMEATLVHECDGHVEQQRRDGWWTFYWRYVFDTTVREGQSTMSDHCLVWKRPEDRIGWRALYEAEAYALSAKVWVQNHRLLSAVLERAAFKIRNRKYPRFWFGKKPKLDVALWLVRSIYNDVWEVR